MASPDIISANLRPATSRLDNPANQSNVASPQWLVDAGGWGRDSEWGTWGNVDNALKFNARNGRDFDLKNIRSDLFVQWHDIPTRDKSLDHLEGKEWAEVQLYRSGQIQKEAGAPLPTFTGQQVLQHLEENQEKETALVIETTDLKNEIATLEATLQSVRHRKTEVDNYLYDIRSTGEQLAILYRITNARSV